MNENDYKQILAKMCNLCSRSEKCEFEIRQKLIKLDVDIVNSDKIITYLINNNFINNERYAQAYVNDKFKFNKWGKLKIKQKLQFNKIEFKYINTSLSNLNTDTYKEVLSIILIKKKKYINDTSNYTVKQKLINHAISKGYELDIILEVISEYQICQI